MSSHQNKKRDIHFLDKSLTKTKEWLKDIEHELHLNSEHEAYSCLRALLHCLRDQLTPDEVAQLGAQLPILLRGVYYDGWDPQINPHKIRHVKEFFDAVSNKLRRNLNPSHVTEGVLKVLELRLTKGEVESLKGTLPHHIADLWPSQGHGSKQEEETSRREILEEIFHRR
jgi:uncharacterized protein (DUF2267 family)